MKRDIKSTHFRSGEVGEDVILAPSTYQTKIYFKVRNVIKLKTCWSDSI